MIRNAKFWTTMAVFQVFFGFAVFAITRDYYRQDTPVVRAHAATISPSASTWQGINENDISRLTPEVFGDSNMQDPAQISRQADEFFARRQYDQAANWYKRLLEFDPQNAEVHNNLGLTLHYLGRSDEALQILNEGVGLDSTNQRIWLTLGYVNSQLGNTSEARAALGKAAQIGEDESIRQSATRMLDELP
ncbi:MAG: tetratricopeptide repeat protein [Woeseiaceae bacterium]